MRHATFSPLRLGGCPILRPRRRVVVLRRRCNSGARAADRSLVLQPAGRCAVVPPAAVQGSISARPTRHVSPTTPWSTPTEWRGRPVNRAKDPRKPDSLHMLAGALATFTQIENDCTGGPNRDEVLPVHLRMCYRLSIGHFFCESIFFMQPHAQTYAELSPQNPPPTQREGTPGASPNGEPSHSTGPRGP